MTAALSSYAEGNALRTEGMQTKRPEEGRAVIRGRSEETQFNGSFEEDDGQKVGG